MSGITGNILRDKQNSGVHRGAGWRNPALRARTGDGNFTGTVPPSLRPGFSASEAGQGASVGSRSGAVLFCRRGADGSVSLSDFRSGQSGPAHAGGDTKVQYPLCIRGTAFRFRDGGKSDSFDGEPGICQRFLRGLLSGRRRLCAGGIRLSVQQYRSFRFVRKRAAERNLL